MGHVDQAHPLLRDFALELVKHRDCSVVCSHRGKEAQQQAFASGASRARFGESPHNYFPALALDIVPYPEAYASDPALWALGAFGLDLAIRMGRPIEWGGAWLVRYRFQDLPHFQLRDWRSYL
ncbi:MAG: hypothetical protein P1V51_20005 [Deltaproteobacteria bacterium]|nr:hypothetical protein [Deltaproteobacteria bacterium]